MSHRRTQGERRPHEASQAPPAHGRGGGPHPKRRGPRPARQVGWRSNRRTWIAAATVAAAALIVVGIVVARGNSGKTSFASLSPGAPVQLEGTSPITGEPVDIAAFTGKPVVINIWASWCTGCAAEARALARFARAHPEAQVLGIDTQDNSGDAKAFYREFGWKHPSVADPDGGTAARFGLQGLPTTIFLDKQHRLVTEIIGETNLEGFERGLREAISASS